MPSPYTSIPEFFHEKGPADLERFVSLSLAISQRVYTLLEEKGWSVSDLAAALHEPEEEVRSWLSGLHNLSLRQISRLETALGAEILRPA